MISYSQCVAKLQEGSNVTIAPRGNSMTPRIKSKQEIVIEPATTRSVEVGDVVFCKVKGRYFVHLVTAKRQDKVQISNNHGHVNGWTGQVFGKVIGV